MNLVRKYMGVIWIILAIIAGYYLVVSQAIPKFESGKTEDKIPAIIYALILTPIIVGGLSVFGYYALKGEYDFWEDEEHHKHIKED
jgi:small-conductance mechanosensitive channel